MLDSELVVLIDVVLVSTTDNERSSKLVVVTILISMGLSHNDIYGV